MKLQRDTTELTHILVSVFVRTYSPDRKEEALGFTLAAIARNMASGWGSWILRGQIIGVYVRL